jgi:hypothetical protein
MDFYEVLDQVATLLQKRKRVTYGALKLQFKLGDDHLQVLKEELIEAQRVAADEDGKVLVWTGTGAEGEQGKWAKGETGVVSAQLSVVSSQPPASGFRTPNSLL